MVHFRGIPLLMAATLKKTCTKFHKKTQPTCGKGLRLVRGAAWVRVANGFAGESCYPVDHRGEHIRTALSHRNLG